MNELQRALRDTRLALDRVIGYRSRRKVSATETRPEPEHPTRDTSEEEEQAFLRELLREPDVRIYRGEHGLEMVLNVKGWLR